MSRPDRRDQSRTRANSSTAPTARARPGKPSTDHGVRVLAVVLAKRATEEVRQNIRAVLVGDAVSRDCLAKASLGPKLVQAGATNGNASKQKQVTWIEERIISQARE